MTTGKSNAFTGKVDALPFRDPLAPPATGPSLWFLFVGLCLELIEDSVDEHEGAFVNLGRVDELLRVTDGFAHFLELLHGLRPSLAQQSGIKTFCKDPAHHRVAGLLLATLEERELLQ